MIPYIGIVICWIPAVLLAAFQWGDFWHPFWVTIVFIVIQNLEGMFYAPRIVGNSVGLHPMTVIVSIFVWGLLIGGLLGPILAVPLTATIKVLLARYVWGRRLREEVEESTEQFPVVEKSEAATQPYASRVEPFGLCAVIIFAAPGNSTRDTRTNVKFPASEK